MMMTVCRASVIAVLTLCSAKRCLKRHWMQGTQFLQPQRYHTSNFILQKKNARSPQLPVQGANLVCSFLTSDVPLLTTGAKVIVVQR